MNVRIEPHTLKRAVERGTSEDEIIENLQTGLTISAKGNRVAKTKVFPFQQSRNGNFYEEKKLEVYYVVEGDTMVTITVCVFFGRF